MYGIARRRPYLSKSTPTSRPNTPPDDYNSALALGTVGVDSKRSEMVQYFAEVSSEEEDERGRYSGRGSATQILNVTEGKSGIGWKYAGQGLSLLSISIEESSSISRNATYGNASFARQLYIHALTYLLRGLPPDMTTDEQISIRSALPSGVVLPLRIEAANEATLASSTGNRINPAAHRQPPPPPSILHRALASSIIQLILLLSFLLPYIRIVLKRIYEYERRNRVTERVLAGSIETVDGLGRRGWGVSAAVWSAGFGDLFGWLFEEVGSGVREGVGQGLVRVRAASEAVAEMEKDRDRDKGGPVSMRL